MKKFYKRLLSVLLVSVFAFSVACNKESGTTDMQTTDELFIAVEDSKIERFDSANLTLKEGVEAVEWNSSNESVAVVENGTLIGLKTGTTVLSAESGNKKQEQIITVFDEGRKPEIDVDYIPVMRGNSYKMDTQAYFNGSELKGASFSYSVSDSSVAAVDDNVVTGVSYGNTDITIKLSWRGQADLVTKTVSCEVTKNSALYTDKSECTIYTIDSVLGESFETEAQIQTKAYCDNKKRNDVEVVWKSDDENVATVDGNGKVSAVGYGETYVTGSCTIVDETLSTKVFVKVEKPRVKTNLDFPFKVGSENMSFKDAGFSIGKVVDLATGREYSCTNNSANLRSLKAGEYTFAVYEANEAYSAEVNVYLVTTVNELKQASSTDDAYTVLMNDLNCGTYAGPVVKGDNGVEIRLGGTFNGVGHTITATYTTNTGLYPFVAKGFTFKNLHIVCNLGSSTQGGALFRIASNGVNVENCYIETTFTNPNAVNCGAIGHYFKNGVYLNLRNTIVRVNNIDMNEKVLADCGSLIGRPQSARVVYDNVYVISKGTLAKTSEKTAGIAMMNSQVGVLYRSDEAFAEARRDGEIVLDNFNHYWDLSGDGVPKFKS